MSDQPPVTTNVPQESATQQPQNSPTWYSGFEASDVEYIKNKGWDNDPVKGYTNAFQAYKNAEKLLGTSPDKIVKLPNSDDPAEWDGVYAKLGRPQDAKSYSYETPEQFNGIVNQERLDWFADVAHKNGLNNKQYNELVNSYLSNTLSANEQADREARLRTTQEFSQLQDEWGSAYERNIKIAQNGFKSFMPGEDETAIVDQMEAMLGAAKTTKFFYSIGKAIGEDGITLNTNPYTADDARKDLDKLYSELGSDPKRYNDYFSGSEGPDRTRANELLAIINKKR